MSININDIKYNNPNHIFVTTGKKIEDKAIAYNQPANGIIDVKDLLDGYSEIFGYSSVSGTEKEGIAEKSLMSLLNTLGNILGINDIKVADYKKDINNAINAINLSNFCASAKTINGKFIDENCLEGYRAYSFYLEKIILLLNKLHDAIKQGQDAIDKISNLKTNDVPSHQTIEEYVNGKVHELSAELYMADKTIADVISEFESCLKYNADTKSWDKSSCDIANKQFTKPGTLDNLRGITIAVSNANNENDTHKITCFSELNLLNRLRYIRYYYEIVLGGTDSDYQVFPDDPEKGYPCVPDIKSTTDTKATESMGGFELFYVGYLVDRDGSIDAYSSCLEAKSKAITDNVSLQSEHIEAYNQYLTFINRATQLLNESQSNGTAAIPYGAHLGLTYFCGGTMRDLLEIDGVNYIVLSCTGKDGSMDDDKNPGNFNYGYNDRYLLVRADEKGLKALYNTKQFDDPNGSFETYVLESFGNVSCKKKQETKKIEVISCEDLTNFLSGQKFNIEDVEKEIAEINEWNISEVNKLKEKLTKMVCLDNPLSGDELGYDGTTFYKRAYFAGDSTWPVVFSSGDDNEILIWDCSREHAEKYLPKQLIIQEIEPGSVAQYNNYQNVGAWGEDAEAKNRVINSWTTAFSNKSEYINTAIETINTDITALRTKMDTIDSLCSTLRNRSFETKKTLVSNLRS